MSLTGITEHVIALADAAVPAAARDMMRLSLYDWSACGIAGAQQPEFDRFIAHHKSMGGVAEAGFLGGGSGRLPAATAALINGTLSHALDYDDTHFAHIGHPSVAVLPAVLALAGTTGKDLIAVLDAATIGVEASVHVGLWLGRAHYEVGFHQTATAGAFGAAVGAARMLDLDASQTRAALGLCASMASGLKAQFGTMAKPLNAGLAARTGVEAAQWAAAGVTAAQDGLGGALGFGPTHHAEGDESELKSMGNGVWLIESISHKFHACCHGLHAMLEALQDARIDPDLVTAVHIRTHPRWMSVCNIAAPQTGLAAKFSYAHTAAMSIMGHDTAAISNFSDALTNDPRIVSLRGKVSVAEDKSLSETQSEISVTFSGGKSRQFSHDLTAPMTMDDRSTKLRRKAVALLGQGAADALWQVCQSDEISALNTHLSRPQSAFAP